MTSHIGDFAVRNPKTDSLSALAHDLLAEATEYTPLTPESLLFFCQSKLKEMDKAISLKMAGQKNFVALQGEITKIQGDLKSLQKQEGADKDVAFDDPVARQNLDKELDTAIQHAQESGDTTLAASLIKVKAVLDGGGDDKVLIGEIKEMNSMLDGCSASCRSGAEVSMIELQSLVSQRATALQLTTGMMNSINEGTKSIAANIGR
jgi:hypothetical protein